MASWLVLGPNGFSIYLANTHTQAALGLAVMLVIMRPWVRQFSFELALKGHVLLGVFIIVTAWLHLKRRYEFDGICLIIVSIGMYSLTSLLHIIKQVFRNVVAGQPLAVAELTKYQDAVEQSHFGHRALGRSAQGSISTFEPLLFDSGPSLSLTLSV